MFNKLKGQKKKIKIKLKTQHEESVQRRPLARFTAHKHKEGLINVFTTPHAYISCLTFSP